MNNLRPCTNCGRVTVPVEVNTTTCIGGCAPGPRQLPTKYTCAGCPALKTEYWKEYLDNDETDSGTSAVCTASPGNQVITAYWYDHTPVPKWCPGQKFDVLAEIKLFVERNTNDHPTSDFESGFNSACKFVESIVEGGYRAD